jgi:hypothetical protein
LGQLKTGKGQAIFTAECSHTFHFSCIADSVKHGNHLCPICRSKWKDIPFQLPSSAATIPPEPRPPAPPLNLSPREPTTYADDEPLPIAATSSTVQNETDSIDRVNLKSFTQYPAIEAAKSEESFAVLVGVCAPPLPDRAGRRAPVDLVAVLDVSGSMSGAKLMLMKQAVRFVIQSLGSSDRLSIVVFSSSSRRIFPLRRMSDQGKEDATVAVNSVSANGGTNVVDGLKKGVRVLAERREKNPVSSIILLSDGKDTTTLHSHRETSTGPDALSNFLNLLPATVCPMNEAREEARLPAVPVHTFGFGLDHDSALMHAISDASGGTFSFIESVVVVQDAFARCIGGLLSVVAQDLRLTVLAGSTGVSIGSIPSGKYTNSITSQGSKGTVEVGNLYADEEKEFLVYLTVPSESPDNITTFLLQVSCSYVNTESKERVEVIGERVTIKRPTVLSPSDTTVSLEVDRQRNRIFVSKNIAEAQRMAENHNLEGAQALLHTTKSTLQASASAQADDNLCGWLEAELTEIIEKMASTEMYEHTGRAYVLSGLSSHSWQRATTRGDSTTQTTIVTTTGTGGTSHRGVIGYDTPSMVNMVSRSQLLNTVNHPEGLPPISKSCSLKKM